MLNRTVCCLAGLAVVSAGSTQEVGYSGFADLLISSSSTNQIFPGVVDIDATSLKVAAGTQIGIGNAMAWRFADNGDLMWTRNLNDRIASDHTDAQGEIDSRASGVIYSSSASSAYVVGNFKSGQADGNVVYDHAFIAKLNSSSGTIAAIKYYAKTLHYLWDVCSVGTDVFTVSRHPTNDGLEVDRHNSSLIIQSPSYSAVSVDECLPSVICGSTYNGVTTLYIGGKFSGDADFGGGFTASSSVESPFLLQLSWSVSTGFVPTGLWYSTSQGFVTDVEVSSDGGVVYAVGGIPGSGAALRPIATFSASAIGTPTWVDESTAGHADTLAVRTIGGFNRAYTQTIQNINGPFGNRTEIRTDHYLGACLTKSYVTVVHGTADGAANVHCLSLDSFSNLWLGGTAWNDLDVDPRPGSTANVVVGTTPELFGVKWFNSLGFPLSATLYRGTAIQTSLDRLQCSDNSYFQVGPGVVLGSEPPIQIEMAGAVDPAMSVITFTCLSEAKANVTGATEKLYLYNFVSASWEDVGSRSLSTTDSTHVYAPSGSLSRFVDNGGNVKARLAVIPPSGPSSRFVASVDQFRWHITN